MPAPKPSTLPDWATSASGADMTAPSSGKQAQGWTASEFPPHNYFNWWQNLVGQWTDYLNDFEANTHTWTAVQTHTVTTGSAVVASSSSSTSTDAAGKFT